MASILIVEDEKHLAAGLQFNLEAEGDAVAVLETGEQALERLTREPDAFDLIVLDVMLPGEDGFHVARSLREARNYVPILMLTARGNAEDVLQGFAAGADDYLAKPFDLAILRARIAGLLRRRAWHGEARAPLGEKAGESEPASFTFAGREVDFSALEIRYGGRRFPLTQMEAGLLRYLFRHEGDPISRKAMLADVWGLHEQTDTRAIDNFVVRLRRYLEDDPTRPRHLLTVRGVGYRFLANPPTAR